MLGGWGVPGKSRPRFKGFKGIWGHRSEQAVVLTDLGTSPYWLRDCSLSYSNPSFNSVCCKPSSPKSRAGTSSSNHSVPWPATLPMCLYWSWEEKQFRSTASFGHWETSLSQASLLPWFSFHWLVKESKQPKLSRVTETTSGSLSTCPCQGQWSYWVLSIGVKRTNHKCVSLEKYSPGFSTTLEEARLVLSHSPTFLISKHDSVPVLHVTVPLTACDGSPGQHWQGKAAPRQPCQQCKPLLVSSRGVDAFLKAKTMGDECFI